MTPAEYLRTHPLPNRERWDHQVEAFNRSCDNSHYFLSMEQRTGKTGVILDTVGYQFLNQRINTLIIPAMPSGAPRNWLDEITSGMLPGIPTFSMLWEPEKAHRVKQDNGRFKNRHISYGEELQKLLDFDGLTVLAVQGESTITKNFTDFCYKLLKARSCLMAADETTLLMQTPKAARTKALYYLGRHAQMRRCLDGTPTNNGPFSLFAQYRFLSENLFGTNFTAFKNEYAEMEEQKNWKTGAEWKTVAVDEETGQPKYKNLDRLQRIIDPITFRVRFDEVFKDVPKPIYSKRFIELLPKQRAAYDRLEAEYEIELKELGTVTVANVLTRYLRLQQIVGGFWPNSKAAVLCPKCDGEGCEDCEELGVIECDVPLQRLVKFEENPRLLALKDEFTFNNKPTVVWARFNQDIDDVMEMCRQLGRKPVQYDGRVDNELRHKHKAMFQGGEADTFVAKTRSAGRAVSTSAAQNMIYYSSEFGLNQRLQSEVRPLTGTRTTAYGIVDIIAVDTKDEQIIASHRARRKLSDIILNEQSGKWL